MADFTFKNDQTIKLVNFSIIKNFNYKIIKIYRYIVHTIAYICKCKLLDFDRILI